MKPRTWGALAVAAVLGLGALMLAAPKVGAVVISAALAAGAWLIRRARQIADIIKGEAGPVEGQGDTFVAVPGKPDQIDVWVSSQDEPSSARRVVLPKGIEAKDVRAVRVIPGGRATVELLP